MLEEIIQKDNTYLEKSTKRPIRVIKQSDPMVLETPARDDNKLAEHLLERSRSQVIFGNGYFVLSNKQRELGVYSVRYRILTYVYKD
jgi:hypothetical protein